MHYTSARSGLVDVNLGGEKNLAMSSNVKNKPSLSQQMEFLMKELLPKGNEPLPKYPWLLFPVP